MKKENKLIVIVGPTASGKSDLAVSLAKKFNGEIVSADSRQVYKGMDIGSGKITKKEMKGISHYLLDVASPKRFFTVARYQKEALKAIKKIYKKEKLPFIVGGTGFYIQSVIDGLVIPEVKPDYKLRSELEKLETEDLFKKLKKFDPARAKNIDKQNRRRLIRAIEIVLKTKKPVPEIKTTKPNFDCLIIGVKIDIENLEKLIKRRLEKRLKEGMIEEVKKLRNSRVSYKKLESFGLEYKHIARYLQGKITEDEMKEMIKIESRQYAKKQMTWLKRNKRIHWIDKDKNLLKKSEKLIKDFVKK